jgi:hypothetical protein
MPRSSFVTTFMVPEIPALNWPLLEQAAGLTFSETQRAALQGALHRFLRNRKQYTTTPSTKRVTRKLASIHTHATALANLLRLSPNNDLRDESQVSLHHTVMSNLPRHIDPRQLARDLTHLAVGAKLAIARVHRQRGRAPEDALRQLIYEWHAVYRAAGGKRRGCSWNVQASKCTGPFLSMLADALQQAATSGQHALPPEVIRKSCSQLGDTIRSIPWKELTREPERLSWEEGTGENRPET